MPLTDTQLFLIMPHCPTPEIYAPLLASAMAERQINTVTRAASFLSQGAYESNELRSMVEDDSGDAYEGRKDLGNVEPGDGIRFKGRGMFQLTGRDNYAAVSKEFGCDLLAKPDLASDPNLSFRIAGWFWASHGLNELADGCSFVTITKVINGGVNGLDKRLDYYHRALEVLGARAVL